MESLYFAADQPESNNYKKVAAKKVIFVTNRTHEQIPAYFDPYNGGERYFIKLLKKAEPKNFTCHDTQLLQLKHLSSKNVKEGDYLAIKNLPSEQQDIIQKKRKILFDDTIFNSNEWVIQIPDNLQNEKHPFYIGSKRYVEMFKPQKDLLRKNYSDLSEEEKENARLLASLHVMNPIYCKDQIIGTGVPIKAFFPRPLNYFIQVFASNEEPDVLELVEALLYYKDIELTKDEQRDFNILWHTVDNLAARQF